MLNFKFNHALSLVLFASMLTLSCAKENPEPPVDEPGPPVTNTLSANTWEVKLASETIQYKGSTAAFIRADTVEYEVNSKGEWVVNLYDLKFTSNGALDYGTVFTVALGKNSPEVGDYNSRYQITATNLAPNECRIVSQEAKQGGRIFTPIDGGGKITISKSNGITTITGTQLQCSNNTNEILLSFRIQFRE